MTWHAFIMLQHMVTVLLSLIVFGFAVMFLFTWR